MKFQSVKSLDGELSEVSREIDFANDEEYLAWQNSLRSSAAVRLAHRDAEQLNKSKNVVAHILSSFTFGHYVMVISTLLMLYFAVPSLYIYVTASIPEMRAHQLNQAYGNVVLISFVLSLFAIAALVLIQDAYKETYLKGYRAYDKFKKLLSHSPN